MEGSLPQSSPGGKSTNEEVSCMLNSLPSPLFLYINFYWSIAASQVALMIKKLPANEGDIRDVGSIPGSGRSLREGHGNPLQYSCLENPMDRGAWRTRLKRRIIIALQLCVSFCRTVKRVNYTHISILSVLGFLPI